jgi:hypothetical protein
LEKQDNRLIGGVLGMVNTDTIVGANGASARVLWDSPAPEIRRMTGTETSNLKVNL